MSILLVLIPISLALLGTAITVFAWAVRNGQFEDIDAQALDILGEAETPRASPDAD